MARARTVDCRLEAEADPRGLVVTSPDRLRCRLTGRLDPFVTVCVSVMSVQGADALDNRGKPAKGSPNIAGYQRVEVAAITAA